MSVFGIVTLFRGRFAFSKGRIVRGLPAYAIGALLLLTVPLVSLAAIVIVAVHMMQTGQEPTQEDLSQYFYIDVIIVFGILLLVFLIASTNAVDPSAREPVYESRPPDENDLPQYLPPSDPDNPYQPPRTDA